MERGVLALVLDAIIDGLDQTGQTVVVKRLQMVPRQPWCRLSLRTRREVPLQSALGLVPLLRVDSLHVFHREHLGRASFLHYGVAS